MICKSCGATIPGQLLRKDSFSCPSCGKIYRRNSEKSRNASSGRGENPVPIRQNMSSGKRSSMEMPGWLLPVTAGIAVIALVLCIVLLIKGTGGARLSGAFSAGKISASKSVTRTIEIPRQSNTSYIIAAESDTVGVTVAIKNKTQTSFDILIRNVDSKSRSPELTWALIPCKNTAQNANSNAPAADSAATAKETPHN